MRIDVAPQENSGVRHVVDFGFLAENSLDGKTQFVGVLILRLMFPIDQNSRYRAAVTGLPISSNSALDYFIFIRNAPRKNRCP
ncbi:MAG: hypothetical protein ACYDDT_11005 [Sulfuricella sp.]